MPANRGTAARLDRGKKRTPASVSDGEASGGEGKSAGERRGSGSDGRRRSSRSPKNKTVGFAADATAAPPSTACLAEILAWFGFVFEGAGLATKPSVAEAFAMLRLHAQPAEARAAGEAARR